MSILGPRWGVADGPGVTLDPRSQTSRSVFVFACVECLLETLILSGGGAKICIERLCVGLDDELFVQTFQQGLFFPQF